MHLALMSSLVNDQHSNYHCKYMGNKHIKAIVLLRLVVFHLLIVFMPGLGFEPVNLGVIA